VGAYRTQEERNTPVVKEIGGIKFGFLAYTHSTNTQETVCDKAAVEYGVPYLHKSNVVADIKRLKDAGAEVIIAFPHWGDEYVRTPNDYQKKYAKKLAQAGVDIILGTHPHTLQAIDFDEAAGTLVCYSLGDFFGDAERGATNYSIILDIEITKDADAGTTKVTGFSYTPIYTIKESECVDRNRRVVRIDKQITAHDNNFLDSVTKDCYSAMTYALTRIEQRIKMPASSG
jgi:poly-gamma-glutamate synthesis protein (capsule biosynthesis protein)